MRQIILERAVVNDDWFYVPLEDDGVALSVEALPAGKVLLPFAWWRLARLPLLAMREARQLGVWLAADDEPAELVKDFDSLSLIAVDFPLFRDGRGFSLGRLLRERHGWRGELRALGDVARDQLGFMARCGFNSFALRPERDIHDALKAFGELSVHYQGDVSEPLPLYRRIERRAADSFHE